MKHEEFWNYFNSFAYPQLAHRASSFRFAFQHLTNLNRPVAIVETGCVRNQGTYAGEGQSTVLFDKFSEYIEGSIVHSVDISEQSTSMCKSIVSNRVHVHTMDSVTFLRNECRKHISPFHAIDLLYLDSYDVDLENPHDSALHHIKELLAASTLITPNTLILIDDSPSSANFFFEDAHIKFATNHKVGGKGKYIANYMESIGFKPVIQGYQVAYLGI